MHELFVAAGLRISGSSRLELLPLERLAYERPDPIAAAFFESQTNHVDNWSAARHPVARAQLLNCQSCAGRGLDLMRGWFLIDAVEALAKARKAR